MLLLHAQSRQRSGKMRLAFIVIERLSSPTTDRRRNRVLAANPASDELGRPNSKREEAVRARRLGSASSDFVLCGVGANPE